MNLIQKISELNAKQLTTVEIGPHENGVRVIIRTGGKIHGANYTIVNDATEIGQGWERNLIKYLDHIMESP